MDFDCIIANPPYGKVGNQITRNIIENIKYEAFVNLLPANDYRRFDKGFKLYQFVDISSMKPVVNGFRDAAVTTMICLVKKERQPSRLESEFEIENYIDPQLKKYFYENRKHTHYAFEKPDCGKHPETWTPEKTFIICTRDVNHGHMPYGKTSVTYKWNMSKSINWKYLVENHNNPRATRANTYEVPFYGSTFNTEQECKNFVDFIYSDEGFRFISKILRAVNVDHFLALNKWVPLVDWTKPQTVQNILKDYGYTKPEIDEVMDDLENFRGMND